jgi:hypothetical protein
VRIVVPVEVPEGVAHAVGRGFGGAGYGAIGLGYVSSGGVGFGFGSGAAESGLLGVFSADAAGAALAGRSVSAPKVTIGAAVATGDLDKNIIRRYVRRKLPAIRHCYEKALVRQHDLAGTVTSSFSIGSDGHVTESSAEGVGDPELERCVADVIRSIQFPAARGGGLVNVRYPFHLERAE